MTVYKKMKRQKIIACLILFLLHYGGYSLFGESVVIRGGEIHTMEGKVLHSGVVRIEDGKIVEIGEQVSIPEDARIIDAKGYILYPGFIASSGLFTSEELKNSQSFTPDASAADRFDFHGDYTRYLRGGVTSAFVGMPDNRIIPGKAMIVKLGNREKMSAILKKEAVLCISLGKNAVLPPMTDIFPAPVSVENPITPSIKQYPSSSMGAFWLLQELFRSESFYGDLARYYQNVSGSLKKAKTQDLPLCVHVQGNVDIRQAIRLAETVRMALILQGPSFAYPAIPVLKEKGIPVIVQVKLKPNGLWPPEGSVDEEERRKGLKNIPVMLEQGLTVALTAMDDNDIKDLFWVIQYFKKHGGISVEDLIKTITINPAKIFGIDDRVGSLAAGKDADILFFQQDAGLPLPALKKVMSEGHMVYEEE